MKTQKMLLLIGTLSIGAIANASILDPLHLDDHKIYFGGEYKYQRMSGRNEWNEILPKNFDAGTFFGGLRFNENFGLEAGITNSDYETRNNVITGSRFGQAGANVNSTVKSRFNSYNLDANGYVPILKHMFDIVGTVGVGFTKSYINPDDVTVTAGTTIDDLLRNVERGARKAVPRMGLGVQWMFREYFGARARVMWEGTRALRFDTNSASVSQKPYRGAFAATFGLFAEFK